MERAKATNENRLRELSQVQNIEIEIADKIGLPDFRVGGQVIRNDKGWIINELAIDYTWIIIARSFVGWGGLFTVKLKETQFREFNNPEKIIRGIFTIDSENSLKKIFIEEIHDNLADPIASQFCFDLLNANKGITLDGVSYNIHIQSNNIDSFILVNNPITAQWRKWENEVLNIGKQLAHKSKIQELIELFDI